MTTLAQTHHEPAQTPYLWHALSLRDFYPRQIAGNEPVPVRILSPRLYGVLGRTIDDTWTLTITPDVREQRPGRCAVLTTCGSDLEPILFDAQILTEALKDPRHWGIEPDSRPQIWHLSHHGAAGPDPVRLLMTMRGSLDPRAALRLWWPRPRMSAERAQYILDHNRRKSTFYAAFPYAFPLMGHCGEVIRADGITEEEHCAITDRLRQMPGNHTYYDALCALATEEA